MVKKLLIPLLFFAFSFANAETIKTDVLVVGGGASGVAAAIQSARSKIKTLLVSDGLDLGRTTSNSMLTVNANNDILSGIWGEFHKHVKDFYSKTPGYDTAQNAALKFEPGTAVSILKKMLDTVKNLTEYTDAKFTAIKKDGDKWEVTFAQNGKTIIVKAKVVIDATEDGIVATKAGAKFTEGISSQKDNSTSNLYRTSIATGETMPEQMHKPYAVYFIPMNAVLVKDADNILCTEKVLPGDKTIQYLPLQFEIGQGAGTVAAYCAFFKTTTKHLTVRIIQGELLDFKGYLLPFTDVKQSNPAWRAIQQVGATGLLRGSLQAHGNSIEFLFKPDSTVATEEIKPVLTEIYTRAFLWFNKEKPGAQFTVGNMLSLISDFTLTDPKTLQIYLQKAWTPTYKLTGTFDLSRPITRLEFAVLANKYLNPFAKTVDLSGRMVN